MKISGKNIVVTGGANGIGKALCERFIEEDAATVVVADIDGEGAKKLASRWDGLGMRTDVSHEPDIIELVSEIRKRFGEIHLFCSNAGIISTDAPGWTAASSPNDVWQKSWEVHVMAHVYAARAVLPGMIERGDGYLLNVVSAAGLLNQIGSAPYSTTKHAAVGFAEALAITHGENGIKVSIVCPQAVRTAMITGNEKGTASVDGILEPEDVAEAVIRGIEAETFLILPHEEVGRYYEKKGMDYDRWIKGMQRLRRNTFNIKPGSGS